MTSNTEKLSRIALDHQKDVGVVHSEVLTKASAGTASQLLTKNHEVFHTYFHIAGMHNHEVHHLLAVYALGASPEEIQRAYDRNAVYQKDISAFNPPEPAAAASLTFAERLGKPQHYTFFLQVFREEISKHGLGKTVQKFLFCGDALAESLFARLHGGLLHPIIHLGYGIEFDQPLVVAEALADAAIHDEFMGTICFPAERVSAKQSSNQDPTLMSLVEMLQHEDRILASISEEDTHNKLATDLMLREPHVLIDIVSRYKVTPDTLDNKLAEMAQVSLYLLGASQRPDREIAFDFYIMHAANLSVFYPAFLAQDWLSVEDKCRLLEWKGRLDLAVYASCKAPKLYPERIATYKPVQTGGWKEIFARACAYGDDGHTAKLIRSLKSAAVQYEEYPDVLPASTDIKGGIFLRIAHMVMDYVERMDRPDYKRPHVEYFPGTDEEILRLVARWIRFCGTEVAWKDIQPRSGTCI